MKRESKQILFYIFFGVASYAVMMNLKLVLQFLQSVMSLIMPVLWGLLFAFILNVPMTGIEKRLNQYLKKTKYQLQTHQLHALSLFLTLIFILLILVIAATWLIPTLIDSVKSIQPLFEEKWPIILELLKSYNIDETLITDFITMIDTTQISGSAGNLMQSVFRAASSTISGITNVVFGMIIAIYLLMSKSTLVIQVKKVMQAHLKDEISSHILYISRLVRDTYAKFLSGQCMEAIILGSLIFVAFSLFRLPYAALTGFLTSLCAFVPYVGAMVSCAVGAFLILLAEPSKFILCIVVYVVVQFIENQFIYPYVVGSSVGLAPLWTLIAALIGGKLFGLLGIVFFIPLAAVIYTLVKENVNHKLEKKKTQNEI